MLSMVYQIRFRALREHASGREDRYNRHQRMTVLQRSLAAIHSFCIRNEWSDWIRCLMCGIAWLSPDEIAVNARQLKYVLGKSKSSINGSLALLGYTAVSQTTHQAPKTFAAIPYLQTRTLELRQWTVRRRAPKDAPSALPQVSHRYLLGNAPQQESDSTAEGEAWLAEFSLVEDDQLSESHD
jgi:hypothetical protein